MCGCLLSGVFPDEKCGIYPEEANPSDEYFVFFLPIESHIRFMLIVLDVEMLAHSLSGHLVHLVSTDYDSGDTVTIYEFWREYCLQDIEAVFSEMLGSTDDRSDGGIRSIIAESCIAPLEKFPEFQGFHFW